MENENVSGPIYTKLSRETIDVRQSPPLRSSMQSIQGALPKNIWFAPRGPRLRPISLILTSITICSRVGGAEVVGDGTGDSQYPEVRAAVPNTDDPAMPCVSRFFQ